jgi:hypothetical protein
MPAVRAVFARFPSPESLTKHLVVVSVLVAGGAEVAISFPHAPHLAYLAVIGFLAGLALAHRHPAGAVSVLLVPAYVMPGLFLLVDLPFVLPPHVPWAAALLAATVSWSWRDAGWHLPRAWTLPLVFSALVVAVSWPIVVLRELDFRPLLTLQLDVLNNASGTPAPVAAAWAARTALSCCLGLLWLDWLCATFPAGAGGAFRRRVVYPLGLSWLLTGLVAVGQAFVDVRFLNVAFWADLKRAAGALLDANSFGVLCALAGPAAVAAILAGPGRARLALLPPAAALSWFGVFASGSRSSTFMAAVAFGLTGWYVVRKTSPSRLTVAIAATAAGLLAAITWWLVAGRLDTPLERTAGMLTSATPAGVAALLADLWTRHGYGTLASQLIVRFPLTGVGVGSFPVLAGDHAGLLFDNAQNWYRHQLVELGLLGSLGWGVWLVAGPRRIFGPGAASLGVPGAAVRSALIALALASLVGVHVQETPIVLTFWTLVFWAAGPVGDDAPDGAEGRPARPRSWALLLVVAGVYGAALTYVSLAHLRVPDRAVTADRGYAYGFYPPQQVAAIGEVRWTRHHAVAVVAPPEPRFPVTLRVAHPDAGKRPVRVRLWWGEELLMDELVGDAQPRTRYVAAASDRRRVALTIRVSRTWRPKDYGKADPRVLGVMVSSPALTAIPAPAARRDG